MQRKVTFKKRWFLTPVFIKRKEWIASCDKEKSKWHYCENTLLDLGQLNCGTDRQRSPLQVGDHSGNDPQLLPGFLCRCSGMFPERFRSVSVSVGSRKICLISTVPNMRASVLLNCWDTFSSTRPSTSSETCVMCFSVIPGANVFCGWLFLGCSCVFRGTAANFRLFRDDAIFWGKESSTLGKTELFCIFYINMGE